MIDWCPFAQRQPVSGASGAGPMQGGKPKILHHTTEGSSYSGALGAYVKSRNLPHFTDTFEAGAYVVFQHLPLSVAATALVHEGGITNTDNVIQIEHVGFADSSAGWPAGYLAGIAKLCRWIESQTGCPPTCRVSFMGARYGQWSGRLSWEAWDAYAGHLGHCHAPENDHYDPGPVNIAAIVAVSPNPSPAVVSAVHFKEENVTKVSVHVPTLDDQGNGNIPVPGVAGRLMCVNLNGNDPNHEGYDGIRPSFSWSDRGSDVLLVIQGGKPRTGFDLNAWVAG